MNLYELGVNNYKKKITYVTAVFYRKSLFNLKAKDSLSDIY